jgi:nicotinamidase/pyrazinamidase
MPERGTCACRAGTALRAVEHVVRSSGGGGDVSTALLIVDVQHDFLPGGALGVTDGDEVIPALVAAAEDADVVVVSRDAHPADHCSFADQGGVWPVHCVEGTHGAELHPAIAELEPDVRIDKATTRDRDAYSAFDGTRLEEELRARGVDRIVIGGLATDYCVRASVLDALRAGFAVTVLEDAVRGVDVQPGDSERALEEMRAAGAAVR